MANKVCSECRKPIELSPHGYWKHVDYDDFWNCPKLKDRKPLEQTVTMHQPMTRSPNLPLPRLWMLRHWQAVFDVVRHSKWEAATHTRLNQARLAVEANGGEVNESHHPTHSTTAPSRSRLRKLLPACDPLATLIIVTGAACIHSRGFLCVFLAVQP